VAIIGIFGDCRNCELTDLMVNNVEVHGNVLLVKVERTEIKRKRSFTITNDDGPAGLKYFDIVLNYMRLRPNVCPSKRFFLGYRNGRCIAQPLGKNSIGQMPMRIAKYLKLVNPKNYTGELFLVSTSSIILL